MLAKTHRLDVLDNAPVLMLPSERLALYSLVYGLRPQRCLEIGTNQGGSAMIITAAMDDLGQGRLVCVDPAPVIAPENWSKIAHRATLLTGFSPGILEEAKKRADGLFNFILIDGDHSKEGVQRDIEGVLPYTAKNGYLLCHDAHYLPVAEGIDEQLREHRDELLDCGILTVDRSPDPDPSIFWGGLRLLRKII
jgi:predicted O-methyltransferase YrrM